MSTTHTVQQIYRTVVEDVISNVREAFLDEGVDEQVLQELKQLWESKFTQSRALDPGIPALEQVVIPQSIQYAQMLPQGLQQRGAVQQIGMPVQIASGREISGPAAAAAIALPHGIFAHQLQALAAQGLLGSSNGQIVLPGIPQGASVPAGQVISTSLHAQQQQILQQQALQLQALQHQHRVTTAQGQSPILTTTTQVPQVGFQGGVLQLDGTNDTSSSEDDFDNDDNDDENDEEHDEENEQGLEEEPLNSGDDISDEDPSELFDTDNVIVCQYDKINRNKSKWKFHLKDGIMNLNGRDYIFQKATGESEW